MCFDNLNWRCVIFTKFDIESGIESNFIREFENVAHLETDDPRSILVYREIDQNLGRVYYFPEIFTEETKSDINQKYQTRLSFFPSSPCDLKIGKRSDYAFWEAMY